MAECEMMAGYPPPYAPPPMAPMRPPRPFGVTLLAILFLVLAIITFADAAFVSAFSFIPFLGGIFFICAAIIALIGVMDLLVAFGLLQLMKWARTLAMVMAILGLIFGLLSILSGVGIVIFLISIIALYYLSRDDVKAAFGEAPPPPPPYSAPAPPPAYGAPLPPAYGAPPPAYGAPAPGSMPPPHPQQPMSTNCRYCGAPLPPGAIVCPRCGGRL